MPDPTFVLTPIGVIESPLSDLTAAPMQGAEGAPDAWIRLSPTMSRAAADLRAGQDVLVLTWLHRASRDTLEVHPRDDPGTPLTGVFSTRSPDRPNPVGLHPVRIREINGMAMLVGPLEAIDGTPVIDIKPEI